jgi:hypothetical protein
MVITAATPKMIPRAVRILRNWFAMMDSMAIMIS